MLMKLVDGSANSVQFSPIDGYQEPQERSRATHKAMDGTLYVYEFSHKQKWSIPVNAITKANYDWLLYWWQNRTELTFTPDSDVPGTTYTVNIIGSQNPLRMMLGTWKNKYEGTLAIREL